VYSLKHGIQLVDNNVSHSQVRTSWSSVTTLSSD